VFPVGGVGVMLVLIALAGAACALLGLATRRRLGVLGATTLALLVWSLVVIGVLTLIPANGAPGWVMAEERLETCSFDYGGPAPDGFWIFGGGQRMLNVAIFVPAGALLVLLAARWPRTAWFTAPLGVLALAASAVVIELTQLELARLDRACDVTDMVDNATGAAVGGVVGVVLALVLRPWRHRAVGSGRGR